MPHLQTLRTGLQELLRLHIDSSKSLEMNWFQALSVATLALDVRFGGVWLFDHTRRFMRSVIIFDASTKQLRKNLDLDRHDHLEYFKILELEKVVAASDVTQDSRTQSFAAYSQATGVKALLDAPLFRNGLMIGVVCFESEKAPQDWSEQEEDFAQSASETLVRILESLDHAKMLDQLRTRNAELQAAFDNSADWLLTLDRENRVHVLNKPMSDFWRRIKLSTDVGDIIQPALCPVSSIVAAEYSRSWSGQAVNREVEHRHSTSELMRLNIHISPVETIKGVERLMVCVRPERETAVA
jgi:PAS domain-containing protein